MFALNADAVKKMTKELVSSVSRLASKYNPVQQYYGSHYRHLEKTLRYPSVAVVNEALRNLPVPVQEPSDIERMNARYSKAASVSLNTVKRVASCEQKLRAAEIRKLSEPIVREQSLADVQAQLRDGARWKHVLRQPDENASADLSKPLDLFYASQTWSRFAGKTREICRRQSSVRYYIETIEDANLQSNVSSEGYEVSNRILSFLPRFIVNAAGDTRTEAQAELHKALHMSYIPVIHEADYSMNSRKILDHYRIKTAIKAFTYVNWARRAGKSLSAMMFCAAFGLSLRRKAVIGLISTGRTAVEQLIMYIRDFAVQFAEEARVKIKIGLSAARPHVTVVPLYGDSSKTVTFLGLPKGTDNNRGYQKFNAVLVDEAAFVPKDVFMKVVFPILRLDGVAGTFMSSSTNDEDCPFVQFPKIKDSSGELLFNIVELEWICNQCKDAKKTECIHLQHKMPTWFSDRRTEDLMAIAKVVDEEAVMLEFFGVTVDTIQRIFSTALIEKMLEQPRAFPSQTRIVYMYWDPSGGGGSMSAGISAYIDDESKLVVSYYRNTSSSFGSGA